MITYSDFTTVIENNVFIVSTCLTRATLKEARELNGILSNAICNGYKKIIIEMSEIKFVDSTFLGVLVINLKKLMPEGKLGLVGLQPNIHTVVENTHLHKTFNIFYSRKEALNCL